MFWNPVIRNFLLSTSFGTPLTDYYLAVGAIYTSSGIKSFQNEQTRFASRGSQTKKSWRRGTPGIVEGDGINSHE